MAGNQSLFDSDSTVQTYVVGDDHSVLTETPPGRWRGFASAADRVMFLKHRFSHHERNVQKPGIASCTLMSWDICPEAWGVCPIKLGTHALARSGRLSLDTAG